MPADTLVIHGEHDDVVPLAATLDWARPQSLPVVVVPGGAHFFHGQLPLLKSIVLGNHSMLLVGTKRKGVSDECPIVCPALLPRV